MKILVPVNGSKASLAAVRHATGVLKKGDDELILLNVQPSFPAYIARFSTRESRTALRQERSEAALRESCTYADRAGVSYRAVTAFGGTAQKIAEVAHGMGVDQIVLGTARRAGWWQALFSPIPLIIDKAEVPVSVIASGRQSIFERYGVPACVGAGLTAWVIAGE